MSNTNSRFVQDINRIVKVASPKKAVLEPVQPAPIAQTRGIGVLTVQTSGGGITSPLKEISGTREYYEPELVTSSDGLFVIERQQFKKMIFVDADGQEFFLEFELDRY